jgi:hypothetical protein
MKALLILAAIVLVVSIGELAHLQLLASLWIPLAMLLFLAGFPLYAVVGESSLFWGLFDLDLSPRRRLPIRHFVATLSAFAVAGSALSILALALRSEPERMALPPIAWPSWMLGLYHALVHAFGGRFVMALVTVNAISAYFAFFSIATSWNQDKSRRPLPRLIAGVLLGMAVGTASVLAIMAYPAHAVSNFAVATKNLPLVHWLGRGYGDNHWAGHLGAMLVCAGAFLLYALLGLYGKRVLGTAPTVAALVAPMMVVLVLGWAGSALQFYLSRWHIPLLLVVAALGWINGLLPWADHAYELLPRNPLPAAPPLEVLTAGGRNRAILVASAGGGIQAAAWTAKVLEGLRLDQGQRFDRALAFISSISGGSMGSACYVDWLNRGAPPGAVCPFDAASADSLDEVAWGLAWPDLLRVLLPWPIRIDRAHAMERAWVGNADSASLNDPLSDWNGPTARGQLPALVMNSTMVEVGGPLLLGTSDVNGADGPKRASSSWWDGDQLHVHTDPRSKTEHKLDVPVVRAARLSATFPYVTPAARPANADHQPHMMDGGFYDNYGMATLTEWIDQALEKQAAAKSPGDEPMKRLLVVQINGFPPSKFVPPQPPKGRGGWLLQLIDPIRILVSVRTAGQVSHRDVELALLQEKWRARGVEIDDVNFELKKTHAPLSWHLMPKQKNDIADAWFNSSDIWEERAKVAHFLGGNPPPRPIVREEAAAGASARKAASSV